MEYKVNKPYPKVKVERKNIEYASILLNDYAGEISEDTAIHLYFYQNLVLAEKHPEISKILEQIAITEMHHLELLGEAINLLGLDPAYRTINPLTLDNNYWNAGYVNYNKNIKEILEIDIKSESEAIKNYTVQMSVIEDKYIKELLYRIIEDEKLHLKIFKELYLKL